MLGVASSRTGRAVRSSELWQLGQSHWAQLGARLARARLRQRAAGVFRPAMGCVSSKGQPPASRGAAGCRASAPAVAVGPAAVAGLAPRAEADARRSPDDPIFTTKLAATGQPKELRSGLLAAIDVSASASPGRHRGAGQLLPLPGPTAFPCALPGLSAASRVRTAVRGTAKARYCSGWACGVGGGMGSANAAAGAAASCAWRQHPRGTPLISQSLLLDQQSVLPLRLPRNLGMSCALTLLVRAPRDRSSPLSPDGWPWSLAGDWRRGNQGFFHREQPWPRLLWRGVPGAPPPPAFTHSSAQGEAEASVAAEKARARKMQCWLGDVSRWASRQPLSLPRPSSAVPPLRGAGHGTRAHQGHFNPARVCRDGGHGVPSWHRWLPRLL